MGLILETASRGGTAASPFFCLRLPIIPTNLTHGAVKCYTALAAVIGSIAAVLVSSPRNIARRDGRVVECGRLENG